MAEFIHQPLDPDDCDIASDESSGSAVISPLVRRLNDVLAMDDLELEGPLIDQAEALIDEIRPYIQEDGGDVEVVGIRDGWLQLAFSGACGSCSISGTTIVLIEEELDKRVPSLKGVELVQE